MSQNTTDPLEGMDPTAAYQTVYNKVYAPAFFQKLAADYNIQPGSDDEALKMLQMASKLRIAHDTNLQKQAAAKVSQLDEMHQALDGQLGDMGIDVPEPSDPIKQAAAEGAIDPELANAFLTLEIDSAGAKLEEQAAA